MNDAPSFQQIVLAALSGAVSLLVTGIGVWLYTRRLTATAKADRVRVENTALEDDTKSSGLLRDFAAKWNVQLEELRKERDADKKTIAEQERKLAEQAISIRHLEEWKTTAAAESVKSQKRIDEQSMLIEQQRAQIQSLIEQNKARQAEIQEVKQYWQDALSTLEEVRMTSEKLQRELDTARETENRLRSDLTTVSDALASEKTNTSRLVAEITALKAKNAELEADIAKLKEEIKSREQQITELQSQLEDCRRAAVPAAAVAGDAASDGTGDGRANTGSSGDEESGGDTGDDSRRHPVP